MRSWRKFLRSALLWGAAAAWCGLLFFFSGQTGAASEQESSALAGAMLQLLPFLSVSLEALNFGLRKLAHFGMFAVQGALIWGALRSSLGSGKRCWLLAVPVCAAIAALNEFHQTFVPGREGKLADVLLDLSGALAGIAFAALLMWLAHRWARRGRAGRENVII